MFTSKRTAALVITVALTLFNLAPVKAHAAATITANVTVGTNPVGIGVNPETGRVYVANRGSNTVSVIDGATNALIATIEDPAVPNGVAVNPLTNRAYVSNLGGTVAVIDGATNMRIAMVSVGFGAFSIAVNPTTNRVYVAHFNDRKVSVIDGATNTVIATIPLGGGALGIAFDPQTNRGYVANYERGNVAVIDGATNTISAVIPTGGLPSGVALNTSTNRVYVASGPWLSVIDSQTNSITARIEVGALDQIAVNPTINRVYTTVLGTNKVAVFDGGTNAQVDLVDLGTFPAGLAVDPRSNRVYVAKYLLGLVAVITESDLSAPTVTSSITPPTNMSGWNNESVTVSWTVDDPESGIAATSGCATSTLSNETPGTLLTCTATNGAGLSASEEVTVKIDYTAPTVEASATTAAGGSYSAGNWTNQDVAVHYSCADALSGVASCANDETVSEEGSMLSTTGTASDNAGNSATATFGPIRIDRTAPTIAFIGNAGTYEIDEAVAITCIASDAASGIATTSCPDVAAGQAVDFVGTTMTTNVTRSASAADNAGNSTGATTSFTVVVTAQGICRFTAALRSGETVCSRVTSIANAPNGAAKAGQILGLDHFLETRGDVSEDLANLLSRLARML